MKQSFSRSDSSVSHKTTNRIASVDARVNSARIDILSFKHMLRLSHFHDSNYHPPMIHGGAEKVDAGTASMKFNDIEASGSACFVRLLTNSPLSSTRRYANVKFKLRNNIYKKATDTSRKYKSLIYKRFTSKTSISHKLQFRSFNVHYISND